MEIFFYHSYLERGKFEERELLYLFTLKSQEPKEAHRLLTTKIAKFQVLSHPQHEDKTK
jgi:hypothetical protein